MTHRQLNLGFVLIFYLTFVASAGAATPIINFSVYAPAQAGSPLRISKIEYTHLSFQMTVSNVSDKPIVGVAIIGLVGVPHGCKFGSVKGEGLGGGILSIAIPPHGSEVTSLHHAPFNATGVVLSAKDMGAGGILHLQVGVLEADFADGTKWTWKPNLKHAEIVEGLFDPSLLDADGRTCPSLATMTKALEEFKGRVRFDPRLAAQSSTGGDSATGPQVLFSCTLEGPEAVCPGR